jgi:two-component system, chemotaxis family, sensor histidine kinase and response regulator WspE
MTPQAMRVDLSGLSMRELFRGEVESQTAGLTNALLALEREGSAPKLLEELMRGAHSLKGAARLVGYDAAVQVAHVMEECFVSAQKGDRTLGAAQIDVLLGGVDLLQTLAQLPEGEPAPAADEQVRKFLARLNDVLSAKEPPAAEPATTAATVEAKPAREEQERRGHDRTVRVTAESLDRLLALAGESLVASRWLAAHTGAMREARRAYRDATRRITGVRETAGNSSSERFQEEVIEAERAVLSVENRLTDLAAELEEFERRTLGLTQRLYQEVLTSRMRPFGDGIHGMPRMVRDLARGLGKEARLEVIGETTPVDRDILQRMESPLLHLLRNVVDHGIEMPDERERKGKPREGRVTLHARHAAGMLLVTVADDGRGINIEDVRKAVVQRELTTAEVAARLNETELLEFLFLPGFSMKEQVTDLSGRGVGLDAVRNVVKEIGGTVTITNHVGQGVHFTLQLPLTLSVLRALLVEIGGEVYAFPLTRVVRALKVERSRVASVEGREHFEMDGKQVGLVAAHQVLDLDKSPVASEEMSVVIVGERAPHAVVVDKLLVESALVVRPLDQRLGKIPDISAAALLPDGTPALILDVDDLLRSVEKLVSGGRLAKIQVAASNGDSSARKRVLVVDDSFTVRETERKLLEGRGYEVEVATDGMDGWNAVRTGHYDLVLTDVDMPRVDGVELTRLIRQDARLKGLPVVIVSYKDREDDRTRGLEAGADYYLTKASFHDETLLRAVSELIGAAA